MQKQSTLLSAALFLAVLALLALHHGKNMLTLNEEMKNRSLQAKWLPSCEPKSNTTIYNDLKYNRENRACYKGCLMFDAKFVLKQLMDFGTVYEQSPKGQSYGTTLHHQFALWTIVKHLKPRHIIESGINHGLGTWILRQAAPKAQLILLDPKETRNWTRKLSFFNKVNCLLIGTYCSCWS